MRKNVFKRLFMTGLVGIFFTFSTVFAAGNNDLEVDWLNIIPKLDETELDDANELILQVWLSGGHVQETYATIASQIDTSEQIATWIMNRDTIINYLVFVVQFLSQLWMTVGAVFIIYAWYQYMLAVFNGWKATSSMLKNAIIGVVIVIFSYAILKTLTSLIWIS